MQQVEQLQVVQLITLIIALIEFTVGLYIFVLNYRHQANQHVSSLLILISINTIALAQLLSATNLSQLFTPTVIIASTTPAIQPGLFLIAIILLKPQWLQGKYRGYRWALYGIIALPVLLTLIDALLNTNLWYTGYSSPDYSGGFIPLPSHTQGILGPGLRIFYIYLITIIPIFPFAYFTFFDKSVTSLTKKLAYTLLITQVMAVMINFTLFSIAPTYVPFLLTSTIFAVGYSYAAFWQLISERRLQTGKLLPRLTILVLTINIPLAVAIPFIITNYQVPSGVTLIMILIGVVLLGMLTSLTIRQAIQPIQTLTETVIAIAKGDLNKVAPVESEDEIGILAEAFNQMTEQLLESIGTLEHRVFERTNDLEKRSRQLQAAADVGRVVSSILDVDQLIQEVVEVIRDNFDLYYVGLFLVNENHEWANLQAGTGDAGQIMVSRGHKIRIGQGMIGWAIAHAQARVAHDVGGDEIRLATAELPQTRSEAAIPLRTRGQIIGAISVQDIQSNAFDENSIAILQTMADLVSIAINNAQLFQESQNALAASQRAYGESIEKRWDEQLQKPIGFRSTGLGVSIIEDDSLGSSEDKNKNTLSIPIKVRDIVVGELITYKEINSGVWTQEELSIFDSIADQLGIALESARLFRETQRRAFYEKLSREASTNMRKSLNLDSVLQTAASEFQRILGLSEVEIRMGMKEMEHSQGSESNNSIQ